MPEPSEGAAFARAALAGNPSDGYGGAVLATTLPQWQARAEARRGDGLRIEPANDLVQATVERFASELEPEALNSAVGWSTTIPQRVGLGSSSALVIAVTRALCGVYGVELAPPGLAGFALAVETEGLGIVAGLQDRVVQSHKGLLFMDFSDPPRYVALDPQLLPPLVIAWNEEAAADSGDVHRELRRRHTRGDPVLEAAMSELAGAAREAQQALLAHDLNRFADCVDTSFDIRRRLMALDPLCVEMIEAARNAGAGANYTGSGGAIVAACRGEASAAELQRALAKIGCRVALA